ncbi:MAG: hypothetical protein KGY80_12775 [Candidatus Thorarchaeota archaeon]|nr:hypothetical protein [Candidatus Thorarchaeota archaeon]
MQFPTAPFESFWDFFEFFGFFFLFPLLLPVIMLIICGIAFRRKTRTSGFAVEAPAFVIPEEHRRETNTRTDSSMRTVRLPERCPSCNASLSPETVDWVGPLEAKCSYCGATVQATFEEV